MLMKDNLIDPNYKTDSEAQNEVINKLIRELETVKLDLSTLRAGSISK